MSILNRLGLNSQNKTETNKVDRLYYAIAENYKISSIELENIQLKYAINETIQTSSEDFKGVVSKVKSGLSNMWEKILEIFKSIRKFIRSIIDKIFRRKIKKIVDQSKEVVNTVMKGKTSTKTSTMSNTVVDNQMSKSPKTPLSQKAPKTQDYDYERVYIYINRYFWEDKNNIADKLYSLSITVNKYYKILIEKTDPDKGLIPAVADYLNNDKTDSHVFWSIDEPKDVTRNFEDVISVIEKLGNEIETNKDDFIKVAINPDGGLEFIKEQLDRIGKLCEDIDKKYRLIDKETENVIKRLERMTKSKKKNVTDEKRSNLSSVMDAVKTLQEIVSSGTKTTLNTLYKIAVLSKVSMASKSSDGSYSVVK